MAVLNLRPLAEGAYTTWTLTAGGSKVAAVDGGVTPTHDDATTYISEAACGNTKQSFTCTNKPPAASAINSVTAGCRIMTAQTSANPFGLRVRLNSVDGTVAVKDPATSVWETHTAAQALTPSGAAWLPSHIADASLEMVIDRQSNVSCLAIHCSTLWIAVDYTPASSGFVSFIFQWLGPLVAVGLHEVPRIAAEILRRSRGDARIGPDEYAAVYRDLRAYRAPRWFFRPGSGLWLPNRYSPA